MVVEHDEEIIRAADYIIDIGPRAGRLGGEVVYQGDMKDLQKNSDSYTVRYLLGEETIPLPEHRRPWNNYIEIKGAREKQPEGCRGTVPAECNDRSHRCQRFGQEYAGARHLLPRPETRVGRMQRTPGRVHLHRRRFAEPAQCRVCRPESYRKIITQQIR